MKPSLKSRFLLMVMVIALTQMISMRVQADEVAFGKTVFSHPDRIRYDAHGFQIEGKDVFLFSGAFHYFRCPEALWPARFQKIKEAGFNAVETYIPWNWHERATPDSVDDFSKITNMELLDHWLTMAERYGLYVIVRPGPYICSEWAGGGFPQWLVALKKPSEWPADKEWLRSDDTQSISWSEHWYRAVCPVIAKHQLTRRPPGQAGVILFQLENEYGLSKIPRDQQKRCLEALAESARKNGIDIPLFTCVTADSRNAKGGPLLGAFDMMDFYPRWEVQKTLQKAVPAHAAQQTYAPIASAETQASREPVQMQNLTLFELQLGFSFINYFMVFGGTNFDDWASRGWTTTYDATYTVRENGGVGEKFQRAWGIAHMLHDHGVQLMHSAPGKISVTSTDAAVQFAERRSDDGGRFIFVRTEDRNASHDGVAQITEQGEPGLDLTYSLEPFGSQILWLAPGVTNAAKGEWLPRLGPLPPRPNPDDLPPAMECKEAFRSADPLPTNWTALKSGDTLEKHGVLDYHPIYYRVTPPPGQPFTVERLGSKVVGSTGKDSVCALANGKALPIQSEDQNGVTFQMPNDAKTAYVLLENRGRDHGTSVSLEQHWDLGTRGIESGGVELPLEYAVSEREHGVANSNPQIAGEVTGGSEVAITEDAQPVADALLTWYRIPFSLPALKQGIWVPWSLHLEAIGNGFIYINGHCLGRTWEDGTPSGASNRVFAQHDFYLPETWLNTSPGSKNVVAVSLLAEGNGVALRSASIRPLKDFAELTAEGAPK